MIILGSAALVGAFGVCQRQISAILITGVMYLLAGMYVLCVVLFLSILNIEVSHWSRNETRLIFDFFFFCL